MRHHHHREDLFCSSLFIEHPFGRSFDDLLFFLFLSQHFVNTFLTKFARWDGGERGDDRRGQPTVPVVYTYSLERRSLHKSTILKVSRIYHRAYKQ
jgi:hypothetical protein